LEGSVSQLTKSKLGTRHYHPSESPDGKWILFGSDRSGVMQLYVGDKEANHIWPITSVAADSGAFHGCWQPISTEPSGR